MKTRKKPIHPYLKKIGSNVKRLREEKEMSLESLGNAIGIDGSNLQKIENGANITLSSLLKICIILETTPAQFFSELPWQLSFDDIDELTIQRISAKARVKIKKK